MTPSDSDDEPCPYENVWNAVCKRIKPITTLMDMNKSWCFFY